MRPFCDFEYVAIDVETKGLNWWEPEHGIFGIAISYPDGVDHYFDIRRQPEGVELLKMQKPRKIVNHNIKFDLHMLWSIGIMYEPNVCECTMLRASLIDENLFSYSLDDLAKRYLGKEKVNDVYEKLAEIFGGPATRKVQIKNLHKAPPELVAEYAKKDTRLAIELYEYQQKEIEKQDLHRILDLENRLFPAIFDMERRGVRVNVELAKQAVDKLTLGIGEYQEKLNDLAGFECNPNPSGDIVTLFNPQGPDDEGNWITKDGVEIVSTPSGKPKLDSEALKRMGTEESELLLKIRKWRRCRDTFLKGHILSHVNGDILHPNINQMKGSFGGTSTGRLSYTRPALQQIPARDKEIATIMRPIFIPDDGHVWGCWDYAQFEFRMFSHYVNDPGIINLYHENPDLDYHQIVSDMTGLPRSAPSSGGPNAKQLNLAMIYDMGSASIAEMLNLPLDPEKYSFKDKKNKEIIYRKAGEEAQGIIEKYHDAIPGVRALANDVKTVVRSRGYVRSIAGRHMRYPNSERISKAKANLCQGSSADCMKLKIIELFEYFQNEAPECRLYLSVHDEYNIGIPKKHPKFLTILRNIRKILENYGNSSEITLKVPIKTDFGIGHTWARASGKGC